MLQKVYSVLAILSIVKLLACMVEMPILYHIEYDLTTINDRLGNLKNYGKEGLFIPFKGQGGAVIQFTYKLLSVVCISVYLSESAISPYQAFGFTIFIPISTSGIPLQANTTPYNSNIK